MLILISKIRKQLLWLWLGFSVPVLLLIFVQTIAGKFVEIEMIPWVWAGINLLPGFILLLVGAIQNRNAGKFIQTFIYRIIVVSTLGYLMLILMTLFAMTAGSAEQSLADYFKQSYQWLLPFQVLLILVFSLLYFREEAVFRPNEKIIKGHLEQKAKKATAINNMAQQQAFEQLIANDYSGLFGHLHQSFAQSDEKNEVILLESQYNNWRKDRDLGLIENKEAQLSINRITMALIRLIENL